MSKKIKYNLDEDSHLLNYRKGSQKLVWMDPKTFNDLAIPFATVEKFKEQNIPKKDYEKNWEIDKETKRGYYKPKLENIMPKIKKGKKIDPLYLDVDIDDCSVKSHEGRHRAYASQKLGIKKIPVVIFFRKNGDFIEEYIELKNTEDGPKRVRTYPVDKVKCCVNSHCNLKKEK